MNRDIILSFFVLFIVLAGAGWYFLSSENTPPSEAPALATSTEPIALSTPSANQAVLVGDSAPAVMVVVPPEGSAGDAPQEKGTLSTISDLLARGGDQICSVTTNTPDVQSKGMIYISGKKVRGIFTSKVIRTNTVIDSNMVQRDGFVYTWSSLMTQGFKAPAIKNQIIPISDTYSFEYDQGIEYRCNSWTVDPSFFEVPTWITFATQK